MVTLIFLVSMVHRDEDVTIPDAGCQVDAGRMAEVKAEFMDGRPGDDVGDILKELLVMQMEMQMNL